MRPLDGYVITSDVLGLVAELEEFRGRWAAFGNLAPERLATLRRIATVESVASSTRIEGAQLSDAEVERLLGGLSMRSFRTRDEQEVAGYADAMDLIFRSAPEMRFTENLVKQLHGILLRHSSKDERHRGHYKVIPNHVEAFDATGFSLGIVFRTATPFDTPRMMTELFAWTTETLVTRAHHPLLVIAVFIVRFLVIHPFQDGNGRLSRVVTTLLLVQSGYAYVPYSSMERVIEENKDQYYLALRRAQGTLDQGEQHLGEWIGFFLRAMNAQKDNLARKVDRERRMTNLSPLAEQLFRLAREHGSLTVRDAVTFSGANRNTVKAQLRTLVEHRMLAVRGRSRGSRYEPV